MYVIILPDDDIVYGPFKYEDTARRFWQKMGEPSQRWTVLPLTSAGNYRSLPDKQMDFGSDFQDTIIEEGELPIHLVIPEKREKPWWLVPIGVILLALLLMWLFLPAA